MPKTRMNPRVFWGASVIIGLLLAVALHAALLAVVFAYGSAAVVNMAATMSFLPRLLGSASVVVALAVRRDQLGQ